MEREPADRTCGTRPAPGPRIAAGATMPSLTVFDHLAMHPFLSDLPAERLHRLAWHAAPVVPPTGRRLFHEGSPAERFWLVRSGDIALDFHVPGRGDVVVEHVGAGGGIGWGGVGPRRGAPRRTGGRSARSSPGNAGRWSSTPAGCVSSSPRTPT